MKPDGNESSKKSGDTRYVTRPKNPDFAQQSDEDGPSLGDIIPWVVEFRIVGTSSIIRSPFKETMLIGRLDPQSNIYPEIDMGLYNGQHLGVSRRHAQLIARDNRITIEDLGSANGTYINGKLLVAHQPYRLREKDQITLGKIALQTHFVIKPYASDDTQAGIGNVIPVERVGNGQHLLIVDENPDVCQVIRFVAVRAGFRVTIANSVAQGIARVDDANLDGLITEMMFAGSSGTDIIQYLKLKRPNAPVLAISSAVGGYTMGKAIEQGADLFLAKPLAIDELGRALGKMVNLFPTT